MYQTRNNEVTVVILEREDGSVAIGLARAGRADYRKRRVTSKEGIKIALGRAEKAMEANQSLCEKNYLRAIFCNKMEEINNG